MPSLGLPNLDLFDTPSTGTVTVHSNPTGAEARASNGSTCRTPCALSMPANQGFTVTYTLEGYLPETVEVKSIPAPKSAIIDMTPPRFEPNPVWAELKPAPVAPPPPPAKRRPRS
ncbi:MAG: PEGA domain-containing protein [Xanthobacteraceae bacterium]|nr:PEGA domain-containing protein [Xanthobacteraceae bacterium]